MARPSTRLLLLLAMPALLLGASLVALPWVIKTGTVHWLEQQGMQARIENIDLNLFTATASVHDASSVNDEGRGFQLKQVSIGWRYLPLFKRRLHLTELSINGLMLDIARQGASQSSLEVAGLTMTSGQSEGEAGKKWGIGLDKTTIEATSISYIDPLLKQSIVLQASTISDFATWAESQPIEFSTQASMAGGDVRVQGQIQPFGETIEATLRIQAEALPLATAAPLLPSDDLRLDGLLHADMSLVGQYSASGGTSLSVSGDSRLRHYHVGMAEPPLDVGGDLTHWQGTIKLTLPNEGEPDVSGEGKLASSEIRVTERKTSADLLYLTSLDMPAIRIESLQQINIERIQVGAGNALVHAETNETDTTQGSGKPQPLNQWQGLTATGISLHNKAVNIDELQLDGVQSKLSRNAQGQWNILQAIESSLPPTAKTTAPESDAASAPQPLRIGMVRVGGDSRIQINDATVKPSFSVDLNQIQITLQNLNNQQPDQPSPLQIQAGVGNYGELKLDGQVRPFLSPADVQLKGKISGIDTVPLSGFVQQLIGHRIRQGTVSGDLDINIEQGQINSSVDLVLNKLQIATLKGESGEFEKLTGMPLGTALNLLRDRDENIRLKLPIAGDAANPDINIGDVIRKAVFKAVQKAVLTFYSPLGVINVGDKLIQFATALRFDPVEFSPGESQLSADATALLAKLTDALLQRPKMQISICGAAVPSDRQVLAERIAAANTRLFGLYKPDPEPEAVPEEQLLDLSRQRMLTVGNYLSDNGIAEDRFILCDSEISEDTEARPSVSLSL